MTAVEDTQSRFFDQTGLIGHTQAERLFLDAWTSGRMHHGWLLTGPEGIGKTSLAARIAAFVLSRSGDGQGGDGQGGLFGPGVAQSLDTDPESATMHMLQSGSHPGFRALIRLTNEKGKLAAAIGIDQVRALIAFLGNTAMIDAGWRIVLVDPADALNRNAANALLKMLEEPPPRVLFLLVSHAPGRLLPTIRSRCRTLAMTPLSLAETRSVLDARLASASEDEREHLAHLAEGRPGHALRFAGLDVAGLDAALDGLEQAGSRWPGRAASLADALAPVAQAARFEAFIALFRRRIALRARSLAPAQLAPWEELWDKARDLGRQAGPLALDPRAIVWSLCAGLARAAEQTEAHAPR